MCVIWNHSNLNQMTLSEKINKTIELNELSNYRIAKDLGISASTVANYRDGRTTPDTEILKRLSDYLGVTLDYLVGDKNEMQMSLKSDNQDALHRIPLLPITAQGGSLDAFLVSVKNGDCEKIISPISGADFAITVSGDSMAPEYPNGSQVLIKKINEKAFIDWGKVFVLDTCNGSVIKVIVPSDKDGCVRCISVNSDPRFAPYDVCLSDIFGIYRVMLCMSIK